MSREGVPLLVIQRQLGHADLAITSVYLRGIDNTGSSMPSMNARRRRSRPSTAYKRSAFPVGRLCATHQAERPLAQLGAPVLI
jgi:hypothetical protein